MRPIKALVEPQQSPLNRATAALRFSPLSLLPPPSMVLLLSTTLPAATSISLRYTPALRPAAVTPTMTLLVISEVELKLNTPPQNSAVLVQLGAAGGRLMRLLSIVARAWV